MFEKRRQAHDERQRAKAATDAAAAQERTRLALEAKRSAAQQQLTELEDRLDTVRNFIGVRPGDGPEIPIVLKRDEHMIASLQGAALIEPRRTAGQWEGRS